MDFTYTDPGSSDTDAVRFEVQDTDQSAPLLSDQEIAYSILRETGVAANTGELALNDYGLFSAAARCCEALSIRFSAQADEVIGDISVKYSAMAKQYTERAAQLRTKAAGSSPTGPYAGGLSKSEKRGWREDRDRVQPEFRRQQFDNQYSRSGRHDPICDSPLDG